MTAFTPELRVPGDINCHCSIEILQIMTDLQNVQAVVDVETVLDLIDRVCNQGKMMIECRDCIRSQSIATLPALSEHCLPLLEALCSAYGMTTHPSLFDTVMLAFEPRSALFICLRSKVMMGQMELDEYETGLLLRTLLRQNLRRLVELMELWESSNRGTCGMGTCSSSVESTINRLAVLVQVIEGG